MMMNGRQETCWLICAHALTSGAMPIVAITSSDMPTLRAVNPRTWIDRTDYREQRFQPSLHAFAGQRADLLEVLRRLPPEGWSRAVTVTGAGKALERTMLSYAQRLAGHERPHVKQIERLVNALSRSQPTQDLDIGD